MKWTSLLLAGHALLAACSDAAPPQPPAEITGTWSGTLGDIALLNLTLSEIPAQGGFVTGTAFAVSLTHTSLLNVTGSGSIEQGYELSLMPLTSAFELRIVGTLSASGFTGTYDLPLGSGSDLGLEADSGPVGFDAAPVDGIGGRVFLGDWEPVGAKVVMALGQNGTAVRGLVTWTDYDCLSQATLEGRLSGSRLDARLYPLDPTLPEGSVDLTWGATNHTLVGSWAIASTLPVGPCSLPRAGTASLAETAFGQPGATDELRGRRSVYLRIETGETATEILYRR